jgi:hypothetical protein
MPLVDFAVILLEWTPGLRDVTQSLPRNLHAGRRPEQGQPAGRNDQDSRFEKNLE